MRQTQRCAAGKLKIAVALVACSVIVPSCSSSGATNRTASRSGQSCAWPSMISVKTSNTVIPDSAASYWVQPIVAAPATRIVISGTFPDARYAR
jgi:hypothetical protein